MFLRPRHTSSVASSGAAVPDGDAVGTPVAQASSIEDGFHRHLHPINNENNGSFMFRHHQVGYNLAHHPVDSSLVASSAPPRSTRASGHRRRPSAFKSRNREGGVRRGALLWACLYVGCFFSVASVFLFAWLRTIAMAKIVARMGGGGIHGGEEGDDRAADRLFTVLVNTFERPRQLEEAVRHYAKCHGVESVRVAWSEPSPPPDAASSPQLFDHPRPVKFHSYPTTSINNRFIPPPNLSTEAVFVVDDDIAVPCDHLLAAFGTWQRHSDTLVGFFPRSHEHRTLPGRQKEEGGGGWEYLYFWRVLWNMEYSMVLTKAAFVHANYLELYSGVATESTGSGTNWGEGMVEAMAQTRAYVDAHRNCEDIAMQMAVTTVSGLPPVAAFAPIVDVGLFGGISTGEGGGKWWQAPHAMKRSRCLADLHDIMCAVRRAAAAGAPSASASLPAPRAHEQALLELSPEAPPVCETLLRTDLFAVLPPPAAAAAAAAATATGGGSVSPGRGASQQYIRSSGSGSGSGGGGGGADDRDLSRLSRVALAVRAPTLAEFVSADMLLLPGKAWKWMVKDDVFGRTAE